MGTLVADDDSSEWSIEILDGDCVKAPKKLVGQTPPTLNIGTVEKAPPFFLNDFSTNAVVSGSGAQSTGQIRIKRAVKVANQAPSCLPPAELGAGNNSILSANFAKVGTLQTRIYPTIDVQEPSQPNDDHLELAQFQKRHHSVKSHGPVQLTRDASSSSGSSGQVNEGGLTVPSYSFMEYEKPPVVVYTKSESEANSLVQTLRGPLGFDLEWRVMWQQGAQERRAALVQLCDHDTILLIHVSRMKRFPSKVLEVIESADVVKTGANILNDGEKLYKDFGIRAKGLVELGALATRADDKFSAVYNREIVSLAKMVAFYLGRTLLKGKVRTSNWEAEFSRSMVEYAANDCYCALMVYDRLQEIADRSGKILDVSTYSCQVNPRSIKVNLASLPALPQSVGATTAPPVPHYCIPEPPRPQQLHAYKLWHVDKMPLDQMCMKLRTGARVEPLKESTVISYVIGALQADPRLPFNTGELRALVLMEASSWQRHRRWIASRE